MFPSCCQRVYVQGHRSFEHSFVVAHLCIPLFCRQPHSNRSPASHDRILLSFSFSLSSCTLTLPSIAGGRGGDRPDRPRKTNRFWRASPTSTSEKGETNSSNLVCYLVFYEVSRIAVDRFWYSKLNFSTCCKSIRTYIDGPKLSAAKNTLTLESLYM